MIYRFSLHLITDDDLNFDFVPTGMIFNEYDKTYSLKKEMGYKEGMFDYIDKVIKFLKEYVYGDRYAVKDFRSMLDEFCKKISDNQDKTYYYEKMYINQEDESYIELSCLSNEFDCSLFLNDEEYNFITEIVKKYNLTYGDFKNMILEKCKELVNKNS